MDMSENEVLANPEITTGLATLGLSQKGNPIVYFQANNQILELANSKKDLSVLGLSRLMRLGKKVDEDGKVIGWDPEKTYFNLHEDAEPKGFFKADDARGTGLWKKKNGVHYHDGQGCYSLENVTYVPDSHAGIQPLPGGTEDDGRELYLLIEKYWGRQPAIRICGWAVSAFCAGALDWRPHIWLSAEKGSGKSTLLSVIESALGRTESAFGSNQISSANASAASIRGSVKQGAMGILLDEMEADGLDIAAQKRISGLLEIARQSSSGSVALRGTAGGGATAQTLSCSFIFSSINPPAGTAADASRILPISISKPAAGTPEPVIDHARIAQIGRLVLGRLIADWAGLQTAIDAAKDEIRRAGKEARESDTIGTLTGCARWLTGMEGLEISGADLRERFDGRNDERELLNRILQIPVQMFGNLAMAAGLDAAGQPEADGVRAAESYGVKLVVRDGKRHLAIMNQSESIKRSLNRDHWSAVLIRIGGSEMGRSTFGGVQSRCVFVPVDAADDQEQSVDSIDKPLASVAELTCDDLERLMAPDQD